MRRRRATYTDAESPGRSGPEPPQPAPGPAHVLRQPWHFVLVGLPGNDGGRTSGARCRALFGLRECLAANDPVLGQGVTAAGAVAEHCLFNAATGSLPRPIGMPPWYAASRDHAQSRYPCAAARAAVAEARYRCNTSRSRRTEPPKSPSCFSMYACRKLGRRPHQAFRCRPTPPPADHPASTEACSEPEQPPGLRCCKRVRAGLEVLDHADAEPGARSAWSSMASGRRAGVRGDAQQHETRRWPAAASRADFARLSSVMPRYKCARASSEFAAEAQAGLSRPRWSLSA